MAKKTATRRSSRNSNNRTSTRSRKVSEAIETQKTINKDYKGLFRDYKKLAKDLWKIPATKYVLGGVAVAAFIPVATRLLRRYPKVNTFIRDNMDVVEQKLEEVGEKINEKISDFKSGIQDEYSDSSRH